MPDEPASTSGSSDAPPRQEVLSRVHDLMDAGSHLHSVVFTGSSDKAFYYLAIIEREYEGNQYLNERYVQLSRLPGANDFEDTFLTNGINRRVNDDNLARTLAMAYMGIANRDEQGKTDVDAQYLEP